MADAWQTYSYEFKGGLVTNLSPYQQGFQTPGSARILRNFEPSIFGGYRRVEGYSKFDSSVVPNAGVIRGIHKYNNQVYAVRGNDLFRSSGSGWTQISDNSTYNSASVTIGGSGKVRFLKYDFDGTEKLMLVDETGKPYRFNGTTFEQLSSLPSDVSGASFVVNFKNHLVFGNGKKIIFSAPYTDNDLTIANGGGIINVTDTITGLIVFRDQLIIFSESSINILNGSSVADFQLKPVSRDLGCVAEDTIQEIGGDVIFLGPDGLRLFSATDKIGDFNLAAVSKTIQAEVLDLVSSSPNGFTSTVIREKSQYRIFGFNTGFTNDAAKGIAATQLEEGMAFNDLRGFNAFVTYSEYDGRTEFIYFGAADGYIYRMEQGNSLDGAVIPATFATPFIPLGDPKVRKTIYKGTTYLDTDGELELSYTLKFDFDQPNTVQPNSTVLLNDGGSSFTYGNGTFGTSTFGGKQQTVYEVQTIGSGFTVSVVYETVGTNVDATFTIDAATLQYITNARR
tara:strand:- start:1263 stop:2789 length:1527 start_codon:yes stop_codon:yes gene_type:complete